MSEIKVNKISPKQTCTTVTLGDSGDDFVVASGVNFKTAAVKDAAGNVIVSRCGSNITIGSCGASIALACGASQTGFGRTGTVNWDTTAKTTNFTAVSGNGYFVNTTSGAITITLPTSPAAGDIVAFADYALTWDTNNLTLDPGSNKINGDTADYTVSSEGKSLTLVYTDSTQGWKVVNDGNSDAGSQPKFITATGGTVTCCGDYKIHTFTGPGTFTVTQIGNSPTVPTGGPQVVEYLVQAGGGGGGGNQGSPSYAGGGGGAGGFRASNGTTAGCYTAGPAPLTSPVSGVTVSTTAYPITVGGGGSGAGAASEAQGSDGSNSVFSTITSTGGGGGGAGVGPHNPGPRVGRAGGSGGGGGQASGGPGAGNSPPVSPPQGNSGGTAGPGGAPAGAGAGGGGIGGTGTNGSVGCAVRGGPGGSGASPNITGTTIYVAQGGGGAAGTNGCLGIGGGSPSNRTAGNGGRSSPLIQGGAGTANRGGGGGGSGGANSNGGNAGSGIVVIRYKFQ